ncbi:MAG: pantoate--beta-alanine ligase [Acidimicrobiales bacterium]
MQVHETIADFRRTLTTARSAGLTVGLVPTMGALHDGHMSLVSRAASDCGHVAVTIFVNPLQFGDPQDIASYPRTLSTDLERCAAAGVTSVLAPTVETMYPGWPVLPSTTVSVGGLGDDWEGRSRPGHFDGVATVVAKLFSIAGPCRAYFGEKDFQQLAVVRRMAADLAMPVEVVGCPTVRDHDGVALSSRNVRLTPEQRRAAPVLARALAAGADVMEEGEDRPDVVSAVMSAVVGTEPLAQLEYATVVDAATLKVPATPGGPATLKVPATPGGPARYRLLVAARFGSVRLIDNCAATVGRPAGEERSRGRILVAAGTGTGAQSPATD